MLEALLDYLICSCIFNLIYYFFNINLKVKEYLLESYKNMIREMERHDPFHPLLKDLKYNLIQFDKHSRNDPSHLTILKDLIFFPFNIVIILFIIFDKIITK